MRQCSSEGGGGGGYNVISVFCMFPPPPPLTIYDTFEFDKKYHFNLS